MDSTRRIFTSLFCITSFLIYPNLAQSQVITINDKEPCEKQGYTWTLAADCVGRGIIAQGVELIISGGIGFIFTGTNNGTIQITSGSYFYNNNNFTNASGATVKINPGARYEFIVPVTFENSGILENYGDIKFQRAAGKPILNTMTIVNNAGGTITNNGTIGHRNPSPTVGPRFNGFTLKNQGTFTNSTNATVTAIPPTVIENTGALTNQGAFNFGVDNRVAYQPAALTNKSGATITNSSNFNIGDGNGKGHLTADSGSTITNTGAMYIYGPSTNLGGTFNNNTGGSLKMNNAINNTGTINNAGDITLSDGVIPRTSMVNTGTITSTTAAGTLTIESTATLRNTSGTISVHNLTNQGGLACGYLPKVGSIQLYTGTITVGNTASFTNSGGVVNTSCNMNVSGTFSNSKTLSQCCGNLSYTNTTQATNTGTMTYCGTKTGGTFTGCTPNTISVYLCSKTGDITGNFSTAPELVTAPAQVCGIH